MNDYDDADFTGQDLTDRTDMNGLTIHGMCLSHEKPDSHCLPEDLNGITFLACNLDNVYIPPGNTVDSTCSTRRFMNNPDDNLDWEVDADNHFIKILGT